MPELSPQNRSAKIVDENRQMIDPFASFIAEVSKLGILNGTGSPEGVVDAEITQLYMDSAGTAGNILYIKRNDNVSGNPKNGWILV